MGDRLFAKAGNAETTCLFNCLAVGWEPPGGMHAECNGGGVVRILPSRLCSSFTTTRKSCAFRPITQRKKLL
jgi:hypothetical protein